MVLRFMSLSSTGQDSSPIIHQGTIEILAVICRMFTVVGQEYQQLISTTYPLENRPRTGGSERY